MKLLNNLLTSLTQYENEMIQIRRHLHQYPEISFQEKETFKYIMGFIKNLTVNQNLSERDLESSLILKVENPEKLLR